jgi:hypothetical protein
MPDETVGREPTVAELAATIEGVAVRLPELAGRVAAIEAEVSKHSRVLVRLVAAVTEELEHDRPASRR